MTNQHPSKPNILDVIVDALAKTFTPEPTQKDFALVPAPAMTTLYIAGPMTGLPEFNYPAFHTAEAELRAAGYRTLNPANNPKQKNWEGYMRAALAQLIQADGIALLPGWIDSRGARLEVGVAHNLNIPTCSTTAWIREDATRRAA